MQSDDPYLCFVPPPEAPVFTPTEEEFLDPLGYIAKIRPIAEKTGICKVKPPPDWQPPFAVDVDNFKFVPRVQRLNELEAKTRIKLNFLDQLAKFWEFQGCALRIPQVERKFLDLYKIFQSVKEEGGFEECCRERKWSKVSTALNYPTGRGVGGILRNHYERILYPYEMFKSGKSIPPKQTVKVEEVDEDDKKDKDYRPHGIASKAAAGGYSRKSKRYFKESECPDQLSDDHSEDPEVDYSANSELKKLQFYGAGPKAAVPTTTIKEEKLEKIDINGKSTKSPQKSSGNDLPAWMLPKVDLYMCHTCGHGDGEEYMLLCDGCDDAFHTYCLIPPLPDIPKGDWRCPECLKKACSKPQDPYGFEQSKKEYSLQSFGEMADQFKSEYFNMPVHMVPCDMVEKEFWRLVNCIEEDVSVQYGADIHASECGSGFPTKKTRDLFPDDEEYINSGWNLNNLPVLEQSVLCHINADISGMKVPWCYVGMCFSSFCWHNEDHWSYSINYLHWGEPKTWYGVPGDRAVQFEEAMKKTAPELFENAPDLLHQLTTIMNPNILMGHGVPIVRTNQHAGEFIITFPRSYHAGFNQGYNFAEAVNFCPADWLTIGRCCIDHYRQLQRQCVFSHEELVCKMAADPDSLDLPIAAATHEDMLFMVEEEKKYRKALLDRGTMNAEREAFELLPDDERQCQYCKTTCFLSAVTCSCSPDKLVCVSHVDKLCSCPPSNHCLRYRYTLDELPIMLHRLKVRAESYDNWATNVKNALEAKEEIDKLDLDELKDLIKEAEEKRFPDDDLLQTLVSSVTEAEKCANVANQLVTKKVRTRNRQSGEGKYTAKLSLEELNCFYEQVTNLPCVITEAKLIKELIDKVTDFQNEALDALHEETPDSQKLAKLVEIGVTLDVDLPEISQLKQVLQQARWLDDVRHSLGDPQSVTLDVMRKLLDSGVGLAPHPAVERAMAELQELLTISERWEEKARICLQSRPRHLVSTLEAIINEAQGIPAFLPNVSALKDSVRKAKEWINKVEAIQSSDLYPYLDVLENMVNKGRPIPVRLDLLPQVDAQVSAAKSWRERTARTFLKKNSTFSLLEILSPRGDIGIYCVGKNKKKKIKLENEKEKKEIENNNLYENRPEETRDPVAMVATFKMAEQREVDLMREFRIVNMEKHNREGNDALYCVCRKHNSGFMLQCELCKDWFHSSCVALPKSANVKNKNSPTAAIQAAKEMKYLCPLCLRSRRPRLETILSLLVSLQKLPVRLPEGEALQCLTERAMAWQDRARQELATSELASALAKLSLLSQKMVEQAAREKTEKIIHAEIMKAANNPDLQGHLATVNAFSGTPNNTGSLNNLSTLDTDHSLSMQLSSVLPSPQSESNLLTVDGQVDTAVQPSAGAPMEHAYSSASKNNQGTSPRKHQRKTPLVPRQMEAPILELSEMARARLEELMMEGDLLEVSLDETQHIWRILQACLPKADDRFSDLEENCEETKVKIERDPGKLLSEIKEKKKRKKNREMLEGIDGINVKKIKNELDPEAKAKKKKLKVKMKEEIKEKKNLDKIKEKFKDKAKLKELMEKPKKIGDKENKVKKRRVRINPDGTKVVIRNPRKPKKEKSADDSMTADEDIEEDCSAIKCLRPMGDEVNWVQCDLCELWFHLLCVGLGEDEVTEDEDYVCFKCRHPTATQFSQPSPLKEGQPLTRDVVASVLADIGRTIDESMECEVQTSVINNVENNVEMLSVIEEKTVQKEQDCATDEQTNVVEEQSVVSEPTSGSQQETVVSEPTSVSQQETAIQEQAPVIQQEPLTQEQAPAIQESVIQEPSQVSQQEQPVILQQPVIQDEPVIQQELVIQEPPVTGKQSNIEGSVNCVIEDKNTDRVEESRELKDVFMMEEHSEVSASKTHSLVTEHPISTSGTECEVSQSSQVCEQSDQGSGERLSAMELLAGMSPQIPTSSGEISDTEKKITLEKERLKGLPILMKLSRALAENGGSSVEV